MVVTYKRENKITNIPKPRDYPRSNSPTSFYPKHPVSDTGFIPNDTEAKYDQWKKNHDKEVQRSNDHWNEINRNVLSSKSELSDSEKSRLDELERERIDRMFRND